MKTIILLPIILFGLVANATNYYISNSGNDSNPGSEGAPWQTLSKINLKTFFAGDSILFKRGDTFYGTLAISNSGSSGNPITFGAYGSGEKPIITGFTTVNSWVNKGGNIWESTNAVSSLPYTNMVVINGTNTPMGRYPNSGYLNYESVTTAPSTTLTSSSLPGTPNWTGADVVIKKSRYFIEVGTITNHSGNTITYIDGKLATPLVNHGLFIQNDIRTLDQQYEWYYNPTTQKISVYSNSTPTNVQLATVENLLITSGTVNYVSVQNIAFKGANSTSIKINSGVGVSVSNCDVAFSGVNGVESNSSFFTISNNIINHSNMSAVRLGSGSTNATVLSNTIKNTYLIPGTIRGDWAMGAIAAPEDYGLVQYNNIDSSGYDGVWFNGLNTKIKNNFINNSCLTQDDGGGIYTTGYSGIGDKTGKEITGNIVLNTRGNLEGGDGPNDPMGMGIYLDSWSSGVLVSGNTVSGCRAAGGFFSNLDNNIIRDNTFYNNSNYNTGFSAQAEVMMQHLCCNVTTGNKFYNNILFVKRPDKQAAFFYTFLNDAALQMFLISDSNYFAQPINSKAKYINIRSSSRPWPGTIISNAEWTSFSGQDANSKSHSKTITEINDLRFEYNATRFTKIVNLGTAYIDAKGKTYDGTITLAPYTSAVLIKNEELDKNKVPTSNAGVNKSITLPENKVALTGSGTDADGTITKYQWTRKSGPASFSFVNATSPVTEVNGLTQGLYVFELTVTDNDGATATSIVQVTVNKASNKAPVANAGANQTITLPVNRVALTGSGSDADGTIEKYQWTRKSGPTAFSFVNATSPVTEVNGLTEGVYVFELTVSDNDGATATSFVQITVNKAANKVPVTNAGANQTIRLPVNRVALTGGGTDADGTVSKYQWTRKSGPTSFRFVNATSPVTEVNGLTQGVYVFELTVTDNDGATATSSVQITVNKAANKGPVVNAGANKSITLPENKVVLTGIGTDADGTIEKYQWRRKSGPTAFSFVNATSPVTDVYGLTQGVYVFELIITDNDGATATSTVQVTVNKAANKGPVANAGANQTITLPENKVVVTGSGTDADGTITKYQWTRKSGPTSFGFVNATSPVTQVNGLIQGVYVFELIVTDNDGATATSTVQVTVNKAANKVPVANAGANQTITLPVNRVALTGSGTDTDGTVSKYQWTRKSGPTAFSFVNATSPVTEVNGLTQGLYVFELIVTDNDGATATSIVQVTVNKAANKAPVANAGANKNITLPENKVALTGSGTDSDGTIEKYQWTRKSGPTAFSFVNATSPVTEVNGLTQGVYVFELRVTDNDGATATSIVQVTVNKASNKAPVANAGANQTITLPVNHVVLTGSGSDADGTIEKYQWTRKSGPTSFSFVNATSPVTEVNGLVQGVYVFELRVTDNDGATATSTVQVTVNKAANKVPVANAGANQTITLPVNRVALTGSGTDSDGTIEKYQWTRKSGPTSFNFVNATSPVTEVNGLIEGVYVFELKVTDNDGATATSTVQITVNKAANKAPVANAGANQTITLPANRIALTGSGTDADGTIEKYQWTRKSGPTSFSFVNATSPVTEVNGLTQGLYVFELTVTDNDGATATSTVQVTVNKAANKVPVANAGANKSIILPENKVVLTGSGSDPDGTIEKYQWTRKSGPTSFNFVNATSPVTEVNGLIEGVYVFELKVIDNDGATATSTVQVTVNKAANKAPVANAGANKSITLPENKVVLTGSGSDADGKIEKYLWTRKSGPVSFNIVNENSPVTDVSGLIEGVYLFELAVTDNEGASSNSIVQITVNAELINEELLKSNAGEDITISYPETETTLFGGAKNSNGEITEIKWTQISGPSVATLVARDSFRTRVINLVAGNYLFELKVTDQIGKEARDTVVVIVALGRISSQETKNNFRIFPNPVRDLAILEISVIKPDTELKLIVSDMQGRVVLQKNIRAIDYSHNEQLQLGNLIKGAYMVTILFNEGEKKTFKILKM